MKKLTLSALTLALGAATLATTAQAAPSTYALDPTHTFVTFEAKHFGVSTNRGRFDKTQGTVTLDLAAKTGKAEIVIQTGSINTGTGPFDGHLKSKNFFNSEAFPTATFVGNQFKFEGDKVTEVAGTLTLLGKTQPVTLNADQYGCYDHPLLKVQVCAGDFSTTIKRSQWGMEKMLGILPDEVRLVIQVEAVKQP